MNTENTENDWELPQEFNQNKSRIMYIENKSEGLEGEARIGRVYFSKTGKNIILQRLEVPKFKR